MIKEYIDSGKSFLGIELGSTRIKSVLIDAKGEVLASGTYDWENSYKKGFWVYELGDALIGLKTCYKALKQDVFNRYGITLRKISSIGISAMMHGHLALDENDNQLAEFRTWRNMSSLETAELLSQTFNFNIPRRWGVALYYDAVKNGEEHVPSIKRLTTLSGYIHYLLTDNFVLGACDASGMFPIDSKTNNYDADMLEDFNKLIAEKGIEYKFESILPKVLLAGENAGTLTEKGALLLDEDGDLQCGSILCPPEGDGGTGMVATNSIKVSTGNISAGTSIFTMVVFDKKLSKPYRDIDVIATPCSTPVAMVHGNNCTSELNAWADVFSQLSEALGFNANRSAILGAMFEAADNADDDCSGVVNCNYLSGEHITDFAEGRPLTVRKPDSKFNLGNFSRACVFSALASMKIGMEYLENENILPDIITGHGGFFKSPFAQKAVAAALGCDVSVMNTAGEGGAWGIALLAAFACIGNQYESLDDFLSNNIFADCNKCTVSATEKDSNGFNSYLNEYKKMLQIERKAVEVL